MPSFHLGRLQQRWPDCSPDVREQVEGTVADFREVLGDVLIGAYLHGSLAMGCFNPTGSDVDMLFVVDAPLSLEQKVELALACLRRTESPRPLELSILLRDTSWHDPTPYEFHYSEIWRERYVEMLKTGMPLAQFNEQRRDPDLAAHITVTQARGVCLHGAPARDTLSEVPWFDYIDAIVDDFHDTPVYKGVRAGGKIPESPVYGTLNSCRVLAAIREHLVLSKAEGGEWALGALPNDITRAVRQALAVYRGETADERIDASDVRRFINFIAEAIEREAERA